MTLPLAVARRLWARRQGLGISPDASTCPGGWLRATGGAGPYLALRARVPGTTRARIDRLVADGALVPVPGVRGCTWIVPQEDAALAMGVGDAASRTRLLRELARLEVPPRELEALGHAVVEALADGPLSPDALRDALPHDLVRSLGDAGEKLGHPTTLMPALRLLEAAGRIRRVPPDHRLDTERWLWGLAPEGWLDPASVPDDPLEQAAALVRRFLSWAAPATEAEVVAWSGLGRTRVRAALDRVNAAPVEVEELPDAAWILPGQLDETLVDDERVFLLDATDNLVGLRGRPAPLVAVEWHDLELRSRTGRMVRLGDAGWPDACPMAWRGEIIGLWAWDPDTAEVVLAPFGVLPAAVRRRAEAAAAEVTPLIRDELGGELRLSATDARERQRRRVVFVRALAER